jgi:hypothetical protein
MPMAIQTAEEYEKVVNVSWFQPDKSPDELRYNPHTDTHSYGDQLMLDSYPCVLPFSQMYPLCCIDIRNFLNQFYFFSDDHFQHPNVIDETLRKVGTSTPDTVRPYWQADLLTATQALDELLTEKVCRSLLERLTSQYLGQIVQILINLEHFEVACQELEQLLIRARSSASAGGPLTLNATGEFRGHKKTAEKRIFELVNSKIDDLVDTADYDW